MPPLMLRHGVVGVSPQVLLSMPPLATKMPAVMSPSMPSQLSSTKLPSGTSVVEGGPHAPQPLTPLQVRDPVHMPNGVVIWQLCIRPMLAALLQSHEPELGTHCLNMLPPCVMFWHE